MKPGILNAASALLFALATSAIALVPDGLMGTVPGIAASSSDTASARDTVARADTVHYESDSLDYSTDSRRMLLMGRALLKYRTTVLKADSIYYDQETQLLEARGRPDVTDPAFQAFRGTGLKYNMKTRHAAVVQAYSYKAGEYYRGAEIRRFPDKTLQIVDGDYCKCNSTGTPDYYFSTEKMEIEPDVVATAAPLVLNIEEVPVLIAPFVLFPLGKGRRSGLLTPKLGGDQKQGFFVKNLGLYWGISDYMDLTTVGDIVEGNAGKFDHLNGDANFRYEKRYWLRGNLQGKRYLQQLGGTGSGWEVGYTHDQQLLPQPEKFTLKGQGSFVSSQTVRTQNALTGEEILNQTANASLAASYRWDGGSSMNLSASQQQNLNTGVRTREYPSITFLSSGQLFPGDDPDDTAWYRSLRYSYTSRFSHYADRMADSIFEADQARYLAKLGTDSAIPQPRPLELPYLGAGQTMALTASRKLGHIDLSASGNLRHDWTAYSYDAPAVAGSTAWRKYGTDFDPDQVLTWNLGANASTRFYGMWMPYLGRFAGLRHTVTPSVGYTFVPHIDQRPYFVANSRLGQTTGQNKAQLLNLSLGQGLDAKILDAKSDTAKQAGKKGTPLSLVNGSSSTSYDFQKDSKPWSDISTTFNTGLLQAIQLNGSLVHTLYDPFSADSATETFPTLKRWSLSFSKGLRVSGSFSDGIRVSQDSVEMQPWNMGMEYSYSITADRVSRNVFRETRTQTASFSADVKPSRDWAATWRSSYNFEIGSFVAHALNFKRTLGCWDMNFGWTPVGPARGWTFLIQIRDLPDVKIQAQSTTLRKVVKSSTVKTTTP